MKQLPNDVVVGGAYQDQGGHMRYVKAVKPKGRGFYVEWHIGSADITTRTSLEAFRRACNVNQREVA